MSTTLIVGATEAVDGGDVMTEAQARRITERIRKGLEGVWSMMLEAYEHRAHQALGYATWEDYVKEEFQMSRGESYRHIDKGTVIKALGEVSSVSHARDIAPFVSIRAASVLKHDATPAAKEITEAIAAGAEPQEAIRAAVAKRTAPQTPALPPMQERLELPAARPSTVRRGDRADEEFYLLAAADLRERLRTAMGSLKTYLGRVPRREATSVEELRDELGSWLQTLAQFTNGDSLESLYFLQAELFDWLMGLGVDRNSIGAMAGITAANVDYWRRKLHSTDAQNAEDGEAETGEKAHAARRSRKVAAS